MNLKLVTIFIALILSLTNAFEVPDNVFINNLHRQFEISSAVARENIAISVRAKEDDVNYFYLCYKKELIPHISTMVAFTKADKEKVLKITQKDVEDG